MSKVTVWNKLSTNYDANEFVKRHGTNQFTAESESHALRTLLEASKIDGIERIDIDLTTGPVSWVRKSQDKTHECNECDRDDLDAFKKDTEDDGIEL